MKLFYTILGFILLSGLTTSIYKGRETLSTIVFDLFTGWFYISFIFFTNFIVLTLGSVIVFLNNLFTSVELIYPRFGVPSISRGGVAVGTLLSFFVIVNVYLLKFYISV